MPLCFQPLPLPILPPPTSSGHPCYTAIYDYKAASGDQVSFKEGKTMQSCSPIYSSVWGHKAGEPKSLLCHKADFIVRNCFYQGSMVLEVSCSSTEAVKWPSNHTKFVKNVFTIIFSHQEGLSWQLHAFHLPVTAFSFCAIFLSLSLCTDMPAALIIAP